MSWTLWVSFTTGVEPIVLDFERREDALRTMFDVLKNGVRHEYEDGYLEIRPPSTLGMLELFPTPGKSEDGS